MVSQSEGNRPKVLLVSPLPPPEGGIASWTQRILASDIPNQVTLYHLDTSLRIGHHRLGGTVLTRVLRSAVPLPRFLWACLRRWPSVIHLTNSGFPGYYRDILYILAARILGRKILLNLRLGDVEALTIAAPRLVRPIIRVSLRACWCVIPITQPMAEVVRRLGCQRVELIPNCIDIREDDQKRKANNDGEGLRILYVGWVIPAKGIRELLAAVAQVEGSTLTIVGPRMSDGAGGEGEWVDQTVAQLGLDRRVKFMGRTEPEAARLTYGEHDVFILPSHMEGFPNVILEAMEAGMPVIATRVGAIPEMVRDGKDGFLIDVGDVDALSGHLSWLRDHPQERVKMGHAGRERVFQLYSVDRISTMWINLYRRAAQNL